MRHAMADLFLEKDISSKSEKDRWHRIRWFGFEASIALVHAVWFARDN